MRDIREAAELFLAVGGRLMFAPTGEVEAQINARLALSLTAPAADTQRVVAASRAIDEAIDSDSQAVADLIHQHGQCSGSGWLVWRGNNGAPALEGR